MKDNKEKELQELRYRLDKISALINEFCDYLDYDNLEQYIWLIIHYADRESIL